MFPNPTKVFLAALSRTSNPRLFDAAIANADGRVLFSVTVKAIGLNASDLRSQVIAASLAQHTLAITDEQLRERLDAMNGIAKFNFSLAEPQPNSDAKADGNADFQFALGGQIEASPKKQPPVAAPPVVARAETTKQPAPVPAPFIRTPAEVAMMAEFFYLRGLPYFAITDERRKELLSQTDLGRAVLAASGDGS